MIEEFVNFKIIQKKSKDAIVNPVMKTHIEKSNYMEEFYIKAIQDLDISCKDLASHEHEELTNFEIDLEIKQ